MQHDLSNCSGYGLGSLSPNSLNISTTNTTTSSTTTTSSSNHNVASIGPTYNNDNFGQLPYLAAKTSQVGFLGAPLMQQQLQQQLHQQQLHNIHHQQLLQQQQQHHQQHQHFHHIPHLVTSATTPPATPGPQTQQNRQQQKQTHRPLPSLRKKAKRIRTTFTPEQLERLEYEFSQQMYLVGEYRSILSKKLGLTEGQVKVWFQNRRIKQRKQQGKEHA